MGAPVAYVWTHDSIGLGEDGPTHQPVEHLAALRAIPGLAILRPADANETAYGWRAMLERQSTWNTGPVGMALSRQTCRCSRAPAPTESPRAATCWPTAEGDLKVVLIGTGSEVQLAVAAREALQAKGIGARVVSMPCLDLFEEQDDDYLESVLPPAVSARVSVEAGISQPW